MSKRFWMSMALCAGLWPAPAAWAAAPALATVPVQSSAEGRLQSFDGVVEAVRQTWWPRRWPAPSSRWR